MTWRCTFCVSLFLITVGLMIVALCRAKVALLPRSSLHTNSSYWSVAPLRCPPPPPGAAGLQRDTHPQHISTCGCRLILITGLSKWCDNSMPKDLRKIVATPQLSVILHCIHPNSFKAKRKQPYPSTERDTV